MNMASSLRASRVVLATGLLLSAAGCAEDVVISPGDPQSTGSGGSTSVTTAASSGGTGGGDVGAGGGVACVPQDEMTGGFKEPTCADLAVLAVSHAEIVDASGDGKVAPGESALVQVSLDEIGGAFFGYYPGVLFTTQSAGATVTADDWFYGIGPCESNPVSAQLTVASDVAPGTVVTITARVGMLNHECPDAPSLVIPVMVH